ncbi:MAG: hypothetical protein WCP34_06165 [Pseudomonadota bacterium]
MAIATRWSPRLPDWSAVLWLTGLTGALYHSALGGFFRWDDPHILLQAHLYTPWQIFSDPEAWRFLSAAHLTPWLTFSYWLDTQLFGLLPMGFYAHQLLAIAGAGLALYALIRRFAPVWVALGGATLFLVGPPVAVVAQQLMTRHYIEGLVFALLATLCYLTALDKDRWIWILPGALLYLLAVAAKEIYVPLILVLTVWHFLYEDRRQWTWLLPFLAVALAYIPWRFYMLGEGIGGYGQSLNLLAVALLPILLFEELFGQMAIFFWAVVAWAWLGGNRHLFWIVLTILVAMWLPLIPVTAAFQSPSPGNESVPRYALLPYALLCLSVSAGLARLRAVDSGVGIVVVLVGVVLWWRAGVVWGAILPKADYFDALGSHLLDTIPRGPLWIDGDYFYVYAPMLVRLNRLVNHRESPQLYHDPILFDPTHPPANLHHYSNDCRCILPIQNLAQRITLWMGQRREVPLFLQVRHLSATRLEYQAGPYRTGQYHFISRDFGNVPLFAGQNRPRTAVLQWQGYLKYTAPEGWITYSPFLDINLTRQTTFEWNRSLP